jgi:hypothetical protein
MPILKVQLNHPGNEKPFRIGKGYQKVDDLVIREWNDDPRHYRKYLENDGEYLTSLGDKPQKGKLYFWGEWEGNSVFIPINNGKGSPNGIHKPFHSNLLRGSVNTDPYIYGDYFKYATCKQTGQVSKLEMNSLILFGTVYPSKGIFCIDTVFVVNKYETPTIVSRTNAVNYSTIYREETLEQLGDNDYLRPNPIDNSRLYHGFTWQENNSYFSFVPCRLNNEAGYEKLQINLNDSRFDLSSNPTGKSFMRDSEGTPKETWKQIVEMALDQGFYLGVKFYEPQRNDEIMIGCTLKQPISKASCGASNNIVITRKGCS